MTTPAGGPSLVERPRLRRRLDAVLDHRLTLVVAGAGYGKSTLLDPWATEIGAAWTTIEPAHRRLGRLAPALMNALRLRLPALAAQPAIESVSGDEAETPERAAALGSGIAEAVRAVARTDTILVLDDVHRLDEDDPGAALLGALARQAPATLHLVLSSRREPPFRIERLRGRGTVLELSPADLAFDRDEVGRLLASTLGTADPPVVEAIFAATAGWPVAVRLAAEALRAQGVQEVATGPPSTRAIEALERAPGPLFAYLAEEVMAAEPPEVSGLLRVAALMPRFTPALLEELGVRGADGIVAGLLQRGMFLEPAGDDRRAFALHALVRRFVRQRMPLPEEDAARLTRQAARWLESHGRLREAARALAEAPDQASITDLLTRRGEELLASGGAEEIVRLADLVDQEAIDPALQELCGEAWLIRGQTERAHDRLARVAARSDRLSARLAGLLGRTLWERGELRQAIAVYERGVLDGSDLRHEALLQVYLASALRTTGDPAAARSTAERALDAAERSGDHTAIAAAHLPLAVLDIQVDPVASERHFRLAIDSAERAADVFQLIRALTNHGTVQDATGRYAEAQDSLDRAVRLAELAGWPAGLAGAIRARGLVRFRLGRIEEAMSDLEEARTLYERAGSVRLSWALRELGAAHRQRGTLAMARAMLERAHDLASGQQDVQTLLFIRADLARVLVAEDPERARTLAAAAVADARRLRYAVADALIAAGWVALATGDAAEAATCAAEAAREARAVNEPTTLAEALELDAMAAADERRRLAGLREAVSIWSRLGDVPGLARCEVVLGRTSGDAVERAHGRAAETRLRELGIHVDQAAEAGGVLMAARPAEDEVRIRTLGGFVIVRQGTPVPLSAWGSRKARDLLRILVSRRGRPVPRDAMMDALWPGEDPDRLGNRLSVAIATARGVLDPDHRHDADHFIVSEPEALRLRLETARVDIETFLADASAGLALRRRAPAEAIELLSAAEAAYAGDFLEDDPYADWSVDLREEARTACIQVLRALAEAADADGDDDAAVSYGLRLLSRDPYDEAAHLKLVATLDRAGRHGEARRHYRIYVDRMRELDAEAAPFPAAPGSDAGSSG